jgi:hypothetical protein
MLVSTGEKLYVEERLIPTRIFEGVMTKENVHKISHVYVFLKLVLILFPFHVWVYSVNEISISYEVGAYCIRQTYVKLTLE